MTLPLFGERPVPTPEPRMSDPTSAPEPYRVPSDAFRVIEHKRGPFRRVRSGNVVHEYRILELHNGLVVEEEIGTGNRARSHVTPALIDSSLREGMWRDVR